MDKLFDLAESFISYVSRIKVYAPSIAKLYRNNRAEDAADEVVNLMEGIEWMYQAATILEKQVDFDKECLTRISKQIYKALKNKDNHALADILQYDIIEISDEIEKKYGEFISNSMN